MADLVCVDEKVGAEEGFFSVWGAFSELVGSGDTFIRTGRPHDRTVLMQSIESVYNQLILAYESPISLCSGLINYNNPPYLA